VQVIHVHWEGTEYQVVRVAEQEPAELAFCNSPEQLGAVLRQLGVGPPGVSLVFKQLEVAADALIRL
jgi:hypothetical protein